MIYDKRVGDVEYKGRLPKYGNSNLEWILWPKHYGNRTKSLRGMKTLLAMKPQSPKIAFLGILSCQSCVFTLLDIVMRAAYNL